MQTLLGVPERTLRDWTRRKSVKLYTLLETLDDEAVTGISIDTEQREAGILSGE
jgi:hypothetical protein